MTRQMHMIKLCQLVSDLVVAAGIHPSSAMTARFLIESVPQTHPLPKVAFDGEGIMLVWARDDVDVVLAVAVDDTRIDATAHPGTARVRYFDNIPAAGMRWPEVFTEVLNGL